MSSESEDTLLYHIGGMPLGFFLMNVFYCFGFLGDESFGLAIVLGSMWAFLLWIMYQGAKGRAEDLEKQIDNRSIPSKIHDPIGYEDSHSANTGDSYAASVARTEAHRNFIWMILFILTIVLGVIQGCRYYFHYFFH